MSVSNPPESPTPTSLREQIQRLIVENRNSLNDPTTTEPYDMNGIADDFIELLTTYIEAAEIQAKIDVLQSLRDYATAQSSVSTTTEAWERLAELQALKAVLDGSALTGKGE